MVIFCLKYKGDKRYSHLMVSENVNYLTHFVADMCERFGSQCKVKEYHTKEQMYFFVDVPLTEYTLHKEVGEHGAAIMPIIEYEERLRSDVKAPEILELIHTRYKSISQGY